MMYVTCPRCGEEIRKVGYRQWFRCPVCRKIFRRVGARFKQEKEPGR